MADDNNPLPEDPVSRLTDPDLWTEVRGKYEEETPTRDPELAAEIEAVRGAMQAFGTAPLSRYLVVGFLGVGGAGLVFRVWDTRLRTYRALKLARPIEGKEDLVAGLLSEEISRLQEVSHPNVIAIFDVGSLESTLGTLPFYTMTFLRGALPAKKFFSHARTPDQLLRFMAGFMAGVEHLHEAKLLHLDLKPSNVFVGDDGYAVVADLGGARKYVGDPHESLVVTCTTGYAHPDLEKLTAVSSAGGDDNRRRGPIRRKDLRYEWDLFAMGKTVIEVVHQFNESSPGELDTYQRKYLMLLGARLLDGRTSKEERPLGLSEPSLAQLKYLTARRAREDLDKLLGRASPLAEIPELSPENDSVIQVTRGRKTRLTPRLVRLLKEPLLRRLMSVTQLGLVRLVYPGATHDRLVHSLGTYSNAAEYITALYNDPINPLFRQVVTKEDLVATLLAALLHDLGQYQHAHDLEGVEPKVFKHETLTIDLLRGKWHDFDPLTTPLSNRIKDDWGVNPARIVGILEANPKGLSSDIIDRVLHSIVSGPIDVDKLDYLVRDSDQCQTVFGQGLDRSRLLSTLTVVYETQGDHGNQYFALGIHEKGRAAAEALGFIRFQMFRAVYWHHAVRSAKAMLQRAAYEWIAPDKKDASQHDRFKRELFEFVLRTSPSDRADSSGQAQLFETKTASSKGRIGYLMRPEWHPIDYSDALALEWLHERTTDVGRQLIEELSRRELHKRVFVVSKAQNSALWRSIQDDITNQEILRERSEELRGALKTRVDQAIEDANKGGRHFQVTGIGQDDGLVTRAAKVLGGKGTVLIDVARKRSAETLRFYPEALHRGQREEFEARPLLAVSDVWKVVAERLHETAGSIRVFVHPDIDVLRSARTETGAPPLLGPDSIEEVLNTMFKVP